MLIPQVIRRLDWEYILKGGGWVTFSQFLSMIIAMGVAVVYANFLSQDDYGEYKYILSVAAIITAFSLSGISTAVTQAVSAGNHGAIREGFSLNLSWGLLTTLLFWLVAAYFYMTDSWQICLCLIAAGAVHPIATSANLFGAFLGGVNKFREYSIYSIIQNAIKSLAIVILVILTSNILLVYVASLFVSMLCGVYFYRRVLKQFKPEKEADVSTVRYAKHLSLINILGAVADQIDKIVLFTFLGPTDLAIYAFAINVPQQLRQVLRNIRVLSLARYSEQNQLRVKNSLLKHMGVALIASAAMVVSYVLAAPLIFSFLFPQYGDSVFYSQIFSVVIIPATMGILPTVYLEAHRKIRVLYICKIAFPLIRITLYLVLGFTLGILGIVIAELIAKTVAMVGYTAFALLA